MPTPDEYLRTLRDAYNYHPDLVRIEHLWANNPPRREEAPDLRRLWDKRGPRWVVRNHQFLLQTLPREFTEPLDNPAVLAAGGLQSAGFNGSAIRVPGGPGWILALQTGLSPLIYIVTRVILATMPLPPDEGAPEPLEAALDFDRAADLLTEYLTYYLTTGCPYGAELPATPRRELIASHMHIQAERFLHCHELAHVIRGHNAPDHLAGLPDDWSGAQVAAHTREQEIEADCLGWKLLADSVAATGKSISPAFAAGSLLLHIADLIEALTGRLPNDSHPPAAERLGQLQSQFRAQFGGDEAYRGLSGLERGFTEVMGALKVRVVERYSRTAAPMRRLLDQCAAGPTPDYGRFYRRFFMLFGGGVPAKLCWIVGSAWADAEYALQNPPDTDEQAMTQLRNTIKLTGGVTAFYDAGPLRRHIEQAYYQRKEQLETGPAQSQHREN